MRHTLTLPILALAAITAHGQELIVNGDFETDAVASGSYTHITTTNGLSGWWVGEDTTSSPRLVDVDLVGENYPGLPDLNATQFIDLNGQSQGRIRQDFATSIGADYLASFRYAANTLGGKAARANCIVFPTSDGTPGTGSAWHHAVLPLEMPITDVGWINDTNATTSEVLPLEWTSTNITFTATAASMSIEFRARDGLKSGGILIDDVSVTAVP